MREILFRGKRVDNGEWVEGDLIQLHDGRKYVVNHRFGACIDSEGNFINTEAPFVLEVDPDTVSQWTGLTDKNGVNVFDGDIIFIGYNKNGLVDFNKGSFKLIKTPSNHITKVRFYEVIGNKWDNPELMEE